MGLHRSCIAIFTSTIVLGAEARHLQAYKHEAVQVVRRQAGPPVQATPVAGAASGTTPPAILTYITPSLGATPVAVTEESQLVTSYIPQFTLCALPPQAIFPVTPLPSASATTAPWRNYSISIPPGNGTCTTIYSETATMVCATTLTGLVQKYTVTECDQDITFSTEYGFALASPTVSANISGVALASGTATAPAITPKPTVQRLTTYYLAPWQAVTAGTAPDEVTLKVCALYANGTEECILQYEVWHTSLVTQVATSTTSVNISTTIHGASQVIVETFVANITAAVTTFSMSTDMELEYKTELLTTEREKATPTTAPTSYLTITVENTTPSSTGDSTTTRTSTIYRTSTTTMYIGTTTEPMPSAALPSEDNTALPTPTESVDWVSMLGIPTAKLK